MFLGARPKNDPNPALQIPDSDSTFEREPLHGVMCDAADSDSTFEREPLHGVMCDASDSNATFEREPLHGVMCDASDSNATFEQKLLHGVMRDASDSNATFEREPLHGVTCDTLNSFGKIYLRGPGLCSDGGARSYVRRFRLERPVRSEALFQIAARRDSKLPMCGDLAFSADANGLFERMASHGVMRDASDSKSDLL